MKKVLLTAMALLTIAASSAFGMYGWDSSWIDFLTHGNQFRARLDQLGFTYGNGTIKGTFGFRANTGYLGSIFGSTAGVNNKFNPTVSAGIGFTSDMIGIGVGYNYTYTDNKLSVHTPVLVLNALNNNLRIAFPVQVAVKNENITGTAEKIKYTGVSIDPQIRFYTGMQALSQIRLKLLYGYNEIALNKDNYSSYESFGFDFRLYFGAQVGDVAIQPIIKLVYNTSLGGKVSAAGIKEKLGGGNKKITASTVGDTKALDEIIGGLTTAGGDKPWDLSLILPMGLQAGSDIVSLYVEPSLGFTVIGDSGVKNQFALNYGVYGEISVTPVKDLEWYFEAELAGLTGLPNKNNDLGFNTSTGITWYLPGGDTAQ